MISSEPINFIPDLNWTQYSKFELDNTSPEAKGALLASTTGIKIFHHDGDPVMVVGVLKQSLMGVPYLWALMTPLVERLTISELRTIVREFKSYGESVETVIMEGNERAARFAALFGFEPTLGTLEIVGQPFRLWRTKWRS